MPIQIDVYPEQFRRYWGWLVGWGVLLMALGVGAIMAASFTTWLSIMLLGGLLLGTGVIILIHAFHYWWSKEMGFSWNFMTGFLYVIFGLLLMTHPVAAAETFTLLIGCFLIVIGISRILYTQRFKFPRWGWNLLSGWLSVLLGILIVIQWPVSGLFIIGLFVGVDLFFLGWSYMMLGFFAKEA